MTVLLTSHKKTLILSGALMFQMTLTYGHLKPPVISLKYVFSLRKYAWGPNPIEDDLWSLQCAGRDQGGVETTLLFDL